MSVSLTKPPRAREYAPEHLIAEEDVMTHPNGLVEKSECVTVTRESSVDINKLKMRRDAITAKIEELEEERAQVDKELAVRCKTVPVKNSKSMAKIQRLKSSRLFVRLIGILVILASIAVYSITLYFGVLIGIPTPPILCLLCVCLSAAALFGGVWLMVETVE